MSELLRMLNLFVIYRYGSAIGDQLCMTAVVERLFDEKVGRIVVFSNYPELFLNNQKVFRNYSFGNMPKLFRRTLLWLLRVFGGERIANFSYPRQGSHTFEKYMRETRAKISLIEANALKFKRSMNLSGAVPKIYFSDEEILSMQEKYRELPARFSIIQPVGKTSYTPNKEWGFSRFQEVVDALDDVTWLQIGMEKDRLLDGVIDFRGRTKSLRELAFVVSCAESVLCLEGLLNHMAAAVNVRSYCVFSGFLPSEIATYPTTVPIVREPQVECAPCWELGPCPKERKYCTEDILPAHVVQILRSLGR